MGERLNVWSRVLSGSSIIGMTIGATIGIGLAFIYLKGDLDQLRKDRETVSEIVQNLNLTARDAQHARNEALKARKMADSMLFIIEKLDRQLIMSASLLEVDNRISYLDSIMQRRLIEHTRDLFQATSEYNSINVSILASVVIRGGEIEYVSKGTNYDSETGIISFENPNSLRVFPVVSDLSPDQYITTTQYVRNISHRSVRVWNTTLDTGLRNSSPNSFSAIIIGMR